MRRDPIAARQSRTEKIRRGFRRAVKNIVRRVDEFLPHKPGEESCSVAIQWLSQTLDWIQLWADTDQAHDDGFDAFHPPIRPGWDAGNSHSTQLHL